MRHGSCGTEGRPGGGERAKAGGDGLVGATAEEQSGSSSAGKAGTCAESSGVDAAGRKKERRRCLTGPGAQGKGAVVLR